MFSFYYFGECSRRLREMLLKILVSGPEDTGECSKRFQGMFKKIPRNVRKDPGNIQEDSEECLERFRRMFRKIPGNAFNFKLIKATFYLRILTGKKYPKV